MTVNFGKSCNSDEDCNSDDDNLKCIQGICSKEELFSRPVVEGDNLWYNKDDIDDFKEDDHRERFLPWQCGLCQGTETDNDYCNKCANEYGMENVGDFIKNPKIMESKQRDEGNAKKRREIIQTQNQKQKGSGYYLKYKRYKSKLKRLQRQSGGGLRLTKGNVLTRPTPHLPDDDRSYQQRYTKQSKRTVKVYVYDDDNDKGKYINVSGDPPTIRSLNDELDRRGKMRYQFKRVKMDGNQSIVSDQEADQELQNGARYTYYSKR